MSRASVGKVATRATARSYSARSLALPPTACTCDRSGVGASGAAAPPSATASAPAENAARLGPTPLPPARIVASNDSAGNGNAPDAASAPNRLAEMTLPLASARRCRSCAMKRFALARAIAVTFAESAMPSPGAIFSRMPSARCEEAISVVRSGVTSPRWIARPASISSAAMTISTSPGAGIIASTGVRPVAAGIISR